MTTGVRAKIDVPRLFALWNDRTLRTEEVAEMLGITTKRLYAAAQRHGLGKRHYVRATRDDGTEQTWRDPTPTEIERLKEEIFQRNLARMRAGGDRDAD